MMVEHCPPTLTPPVRTEYNDLHSEGQILQDHAEFN